MKLQTLVIQLIILGGLSAIFQTNTHAQLPELCGFDEVNRQVEHLNHNRHIPQVRNYRNPVNGIYQIPVVVHVIHEGQSIGSGNNITDQEVKDAIQRLNYRWRTVPGTLGDNGGADMEIEFSLAVTDENGDCTDGIVRTDMSSVQAFVDNGLNYGSHTSGIPYYSTSNPCLIDYATPWDPMSYYNVYVVGDIGGGSIAGFAYLAGSHGQIYDGTVMKRDVLTNPSRTTFTHELGHAFNLYHTFQGDDSGNSCPPTDPALGDEVHDTPAHIRSSAQGLYWSCNNTDANSCDPTFAFGNGTTQDHINNYLDYSGCRTEYTAGQRDRAIDALLNIRSSFLNSQGLIPQNPLNVSFTHDPFTTCPLDSIQFHNLTTDCLPETYTGNDYSGIAFNWTFEGDGGTTVTASGQDPKVFLNGGETYDVTLDIVAGVTSTSFQPGYLYVDSPYEPPVATACIPSSSNGNNNGHGLDAVAINQINYQTAANTLTTYEDLSCTEQTIVYKDSTYDLKVKFSSSGNAPANMEGYVDWDESGTFEPSELVIDGSITTANTTDSVIVSVPIPATAVVNNHYRLRIINTEDDTPDLCGQTTRQKCLDFNLWVQECIPSQIMDVSTIQSEICEGSLINIQLSGNLNDADEWGMFNTCNGQFLGSSTTGDFTVWAYQPTTLYFKAIGNCIVSDCDSLQINPIDCTLGSEILTQQNIQLYPNPNNGSFTIQSKEHLSGYYNIILYDVMGRIVYNDIKNLVDQARVQLTINNLSKGTYHLMLVNEDQHYTSHHRLIIE